MASDLAQERFAPDAPFRFVGGDPSVDFVNTADWTPRGLERDRFTSFDRLVEWARGAELLDAAQARRFVQAARRHPRRATATLDDARELRYLLQDLLASVVSGRESTASLDRFNTLVSNTARHVRLVRAPGGRLTRGWDALGDAPESLLWPVVWRAADLLASVETDRLRVCGGLDCGWFYIDRSRNGLRRWCEMSVCGTAEKNRRRAHR